MAPKVYHVKTFKPVAPNGNIIGVLKYSMQHLNPSELKLYLTMVIREADGEAPGDADDLAKMAGCTRSNIYARMGTLKKHGLVKEVV